MGTILAYSILSGLVMLLMLVAYKFLLARDSQHAYNRTILLLIYAVSFTVFPVSELVRKIGFTSGGQAVTIQSAELAKVEVAPASGFCIGSVMIWIYLLGATCVLVHTVFVWIQLLRIIESGERIQKKGYVLIITDEQKFSPFTWLNYIVICRKDFDEKVDAIAVHEKKHVASRHWIDLLVAQVVCIVNWFNPAAWFMREELKLIHEYQADLEVINSGYDLRSYQMILVKKAVGGRFPSLANSLNHSKLKKRITMMYKEKSGAGCKFKALALVPMLVLALGVASVPNVRAAVANLSSSTLSVGKDSENLSAVKTPGSSLRVKNLSNKDNVTTITLRGEGMGDNLTVSGGTFTTMGKTYSAKSMQCELVNGVATVVVTFPFTDEYEDTSMTLDVNGQTVNLNLNDFFSNSADAVLQPEVMPVYPGGEGAMMQAIMANVTFPDPNREWKSGASGLTLVGFTVNADGTGGNVERKQSCGYGDLDQIAIDAVKKGLTERWNPGTVGGKPVAVSYNIPIRFKSKM